MAEIRHVTLGRAELGPPDPQIRSASPSFDDLLAALGAIAATSESASIPQTTDALVPFVLYEGTRQEFGELLDEFARWLSQLEQVGGGASKFQAAFAAQPVHLTSGQYWLRHGDACVPSAISQVTRAHPENGPPLPAQRSLRRVTYVEL